MAVVLWLFVIVMVLGVIKVALILQPRIQVLHIIVVIDDFQERLHFRALRVGQPHRIFRPVT